MQPPASYFSIMELSMIENTYPWLSMSLPDCEVPRAPPPDSSQKRMPYSFTKRSLYCIEAATPSGEL